MSRSRGRAPLVTAVLLLAIALSVGSLLCHTLSVQDLAGTGFTLDGPALAERLLGALRDTHQRQPEAFWFFAAAPLVTGLTLALSIGLRRDAADSAEDGPSVEPPSEAAPSWSGALRLLALLQSEGRFIDFLEEDITSYSDAQVGAAVRDIHARCRSALHDRMQIERIYAEEDGAEVEIASGFDPSQVRLTGNVHGAPPFRGTLQHGGWRASHVNLPDPSETGADILAPAEVEIA